MTASPAHHLAQADVLLWLAACLRTPHDRMAVAPEQAALLVRVARWQGDRVLERALMALARALHETAAAERVIEHHRLFDGAMAAPPNETAYVRRDKGAILGDVCGFYRAFGFMPDPTSGDKPDHIAAELEFVAILLVMLARADEHQHVEAADVTRGALHAFAEDHVDAWLPAFARQLGDSAALASHAALAEALAAAWEALMRTHAIERADPALAALPLDEPEDLSDCGGGIAPNGQGPVELRVSARGSANDAPQ